MTSLLNSSRGRLFVIDDLQAWAIRQVRALGFNTEGEPKKGKPTVFVEQLTSEPISGMVCADTYDVSLVFSIESRSSSADEAIGVAREISEGLDFDDAPFGINNRSFYCTIESTEQDGNGLIYKRPMRLEMEITHKFI
ncbi:MAG: hypothetical protein R3Y39_08965 [Rikenellaceae bacterium]